MRYILVLLISILIYLSSTSCEEMFGDFLDKAPGVDISEDTIFSSKSQVMIFLAACYEQGLQTPRAYGNNIYGTTGQLDQTHSRLEIYMCASDEAEHTAPWWFAHQINNGSLNASDLWDMLYNARWTSLRMMHTMLERIDEVPDADEEFKTQIKAEIRFLRAQAYFDMFKRYGGVPIVTRRFRPDELEAMKIPRSSVDSTVQFIVQECDFAAANLPDYYPSNMKGRITKGTALALKAKTLLYAASPLFNTATPYMEMPVPGNNRLICYGDYDVNRWKLAADAAKAVLDWAPSGNVSLIEHLGPDKNYRYVWEKADNAEIIFADKIANGEGKYSSPWRYMVPKWYSLQSPLPTHSFIQKFYDRRDGTTQVWNDAGADLNEKYAELDYRFHQSIGYNGFYWSKDRGYLANYLGPAPAGKHSSGCITGYWLKKHIPDEVNSVNSTYPINWTWYRLAEFYLSYAEALNESMGPVQEAYDAVNRVRTRSGMPDLPSGLNQDEFRERVRKERGVELAFEDHRWWDILRWKIGEEVVNGPMYGLKIYKNVPITDPLTFRYERYPFETRVWKSKFYLTNFPIAEVNKGYLVQNPGW